MDFKTWQRHFNKSTHDITGIRFIKAAKHDHFDQRFLNELLRLLGCFIKKK